MEPDQRRRGVFLLEKNGGHLLAEVAWWLFGDFRLLDGGDTLQREAVRTGSGREKDKGRGDLR